MEPITAIASTSSFGQIERMQIRTVPDAEKARFEKALGETGSNQADELDVSDPHSIHDSELLVEGDFHRDMPSTQSLGGAFIEGIQGIKNTLEARSARISGQLTALAGNPMSLQDAIRVQYELMQMNMQQELTSKMADKTSQGVQMLFRNQG